MNQLAQTLRSMAATLNAEADRLDLPASGAGGGTVAAVDAPFGAYPDGTARTAPAYDACRPMWESAQRAGAFDVHAHIGQGIQQGAAQITNPKLVDQRVLEDAIVALGASAWGQAWLAHDVNAEMIREDYLRRFRGYKVRRVYDKLGNVTGYAHE